MIARRPRASSPSASRLLAAALAAVASAACERPLPSRPVREVVRELLYDPSSWTVVSAAPDAPPHVEVLTPSLDWKVNGGDMPALVMPPPCEVRFEIRDEDGPVHLRASAGADRRLRWQLAQAPDGCEVVFEIQVDGERRFLARVPAGAQGEELAWRHVGGADGLALRPGDVVTLRTSLSRPDTPVQGDLDLLVGFGRLALERWTERPRERATPATPNVVLIVMDTLRADALSCYGAPQGTSPEIDALAREGVLHERAYASSSWTWPSTASILTGLPPETHGVVDDGACYLDGRLDTIAEALLRRDYVTGAFACNPLLDPVKNFDQGFEGYVYFREFRKSDRVLPAIDDWIETNQEARFFLYLHLVDPHEPIEPLPGDRGRLEALRPQGCAEDAVAACKRAVQDGKALTGDGRLDADLVLQRSHQEFLRARYASGVAAADHYVGEILRALRERGLLDRTVVAFTSDHGEELFDHGSIGHGQTLHQELVRAPLILAGPGIPRGVRSATPVPNAALAWTLARRCGAELEGSPERIDLASAVATGPSAIHFSTEHGWTWNRHRTTIRGLLEWPWVLHVAPRELPWGAAEDADPGQGVVRLYDLESDPDEAVDRSREHADLVRAMRERLDAHAAAAEAGRTGLRLGAGEATLDLLRRVGYAGDER